MEVFPPVKGNILLVDGDARQRKLLADTLRPHFGISTCADSERALALLQGTQPDLVLLDVAVLGSDGYALCSRIKGDVLTRHVPVLLLNNKADDQGEELGLQLGAVDYIVRPVRPAILLSRVNAHMADARAHQAVRVNNEYLRFEIGKRSRQLTAMQDVTILAMASLSETRDVDTGNHLRRTQNYVRLLARHMQTVPGYREYLSDAMVDILFRCAPLHDIGKVGIPDRILLKPGRYTADEYELMKRHPALGRDALAKAQRLAGETAHRAEEQDDFFEVAKELVYSHHEKWDGSGYPQGLKGREIPISARLMALADVYDALISERVYKKAMTHAQAEEIIVRGRGSYFDPALVDAFLRLGDAFQAVAQRYADTADELAEKADFVTSAIGPYAS